ncbi:hypothetical protein N7474_004423 [Penicillium riverlandense]|uniref:uncharacterized protein n=1 Tax=Penicillium riverlandense TaxID=1903569 RepID=UPI002548D754|nr:uncharacterized protein N7474_004423 [Penicillium riverlandense]KAJ5818832.1 hypothetical protein N7474_004423 [Penicillium riverlandense]
MTEPSGQSSEPERPSTAVVRDSRPRSSHDSSSQDDQREALELQEIQTREDNELDYSTPSASSGDEYRPPTRRIVSHASVRKARESRKGLWGKLTRFWTRNVTLTVSQKSNRDHFAMERTFLAYIRTSTVIAMQGVLVAQLFRLQQSKSEQGTLRFQQVGVPLSVACHCVAILVGLIGAYRFWKQQGAIALGKIYAGGWEVNMVGILLFCVIATTLALSIAIVVQIDSAPPSLIGRLMRW